MALLWAEIKRDSIFLLRFPFLSHVQVILCTISTICRLKYLYSCFSSDFCFLVFCCRSIIITIYSLRVFHITVSWWFPQFSRTLFSILAVLNNTVVWMVSSRPPTSKSSSPFNNPLLTVPKARITIGIIVTFMFRNGVMVKAMHCGIVVREFVLQSRYYIHFRANTLGKGMNPLILPPAMGK